MLVGVGACGVGSAENGRASAGALKQGYGRLCSELADAWWDMGSNTSDALPGIRSTDGTGGWNTGRPNFNDRPSRVANACGESF